MYHRGCPRALLCLTTQGHRCPWLSVPGASAHLFGTLSWNPLLIERWIPSGRKIACPLATILSFHQSDSTSCFRVTHPNLASIHTCMCPHTSILSKLPHDWQASVHMCEPVHLHPIEHANNQTCMYTHVHTACLHTLTTYLCTFMHTPTLAHTCAEPYL